MSNKNNTWSIHLHIDHRTMVVLLTFVSVTKEVAVTLGTRYSGFRSYNYAFATLLPIAS